MQSHLRTPLIVDVDMQPPQYLARLTKPARKNFKATLKTGYKVFQLAFEARMLESFMRLWSTQIGGKWQFGPEYFTRLDAEGCLKIYGAVQDTQIVAVLPMERFGDFMYAQPVMYHKQEHPKVAKFLWFQMLLDACASPIRYVDLGGGFHGTWRNFIRSRKNDQAFAYKWQFVAKSVKENPELERPWLVQRCACQWKFLTIDPQPCPKCGDMP